MELVFARAGADSVRVLALERYCQLKGQRRQQILTITGPVPSYATIVDVCGKAANRQLGGCDSVMEDKTVSKGLVQVKWAVLRCGSGAGVDHSNRFNSTFEKGRCKFDLPISADFRGQQLLE